MPVQLNLDYPESVPTRIRWQVLPQQREYIYSVLIEIRKHICERPYHPYLEAIAEELNSLLPEVQYSPDGSEFIHPAGYTWRPKIHRQPRSLLQLATGLEELHSRYGVIRRKHKLGIDLKPNV